MPTATAATKTLALTPHDLVGRAVVDLDQPAFPAGQWLHASSVGDGVEYRIQPGTLSAFSWLSADFLLSGAQLAGFALVLREGETAAEFSLIFGLINECQGRLRVPLAAVNQNQWALGREGAAVKRICSGARVDLAKVDRIILRVERIGLQPIRWCMTPLAASEEEPERLTDPLLPAGPLVDALGQSTLHNWPGKTPSGVALHERLAKQLEQSAAAKWPGGFSRWGGWEERQFAATGFFRTHHDGRRWWLVDPDGHPFWSAGPDCVSMNIESSVGGIERAAKWLPAREGLFGNAWGTRHSNAVNFLVSNFIRVFREQWYESWTKIALASLKQIGFNTIANWSDWKIAQAAGFPYVRPMEFVPKHTPRIFRDFPDVFAATMADDARDYASQLTEHAGDRAFIGYFLMNEPTWGFANMTPAEGMLFNIETCACREELASRLQLEYGSDSALSNAWKMPVSFASIRTGRWTGQVTEACRADLTAFSSMMVNRYFRTLSTACKSVDPDHINLGARYYTVPPRWALEGMKSFDVFSINCYRQQVPADQLKLIEQVTGKPTMIGEWHFGALDAGLPASGIGHVKSQQDRGRAYRYYLEQAAAIPQCIGVHWFTLYDQSVLGRFDGENYNIGFYDTCNRPYEELCSAALESHTRMYQVAAGETAPFSDRPEYLPLLFI